MNSSKKKTAKERADAIGKRALDNVMAQAQRELTKSAGEAVRKMAKKGARIGDVKISDDAYKNKYTQGQKRALRALRPNNEALTRMGRMHVKRLAKRGAVAVAGSVGYAIGTALNKKYDISGKVADAVLKARGAEGYMASSGRGKVFTKNAAYAGTDVDGGSYRAAKKKKKR